MGLTDASLPVGASASHHAAARWRVRYTWPGGGVAMKDAISGEFSEGSHHSRDSTVRCLDGIQTVVFISKDLNIL